MSNQSNLGFSYAEIAKSLNKDPSHIKQAIYRNPGYFDKIKHDGRKVTLLMTTDTTNAIQQRIDDFEENEQKQAEKVQVEIAQKKEDVHLMTEAKNFIEVYKKELGKQLKKSSDCILLEFMDLAEFSIPLSDELIQNPENLLTILETAIDEFGLAKNLRVRVKNIPDSQRLNIESIRSRHIDKLIMVEGRVVNITDVRPQCVEAKFECPSCGTTISVLQISKKFREPTRCSCGRRGGFKLISKEMVDTARLTLEDLQEKTDNPHTRRLNLFIKEDLTSEKNIPMFTPGNEVKIVGVLKEVPVKLSSGGIAVTFALAMEVNSAELSEEEVDIKTYTKEEVRKIKELAVKIDDEGFSAINSSFAPDIYGYQDIKNSIILQLCNKRNSSVKGEMRSKPNILLMGDPGIAKSVLGNFAIDITPGARKVTGGGSSAVGLTASVVKEEDGWRIEPGAFVLAKDLLFLDELNNLNEDDKPKLQEALSEKSVTINKATIRMTMKVTAGALATANPQNGVFRLNEDIVKQFNLPQPIINRFDLIFVMRDIVDKERDELIAS